MILPSFRLPGVIPGIVNSKAFMLDLYTNDAENKKAFGQCYYENKSAWEDISYNYEVQ